MHEPGNVEDVITDDALRLAKYAGIESVNEAWQVVSLSRYAVLASVFLLHAVGRGLYEEVLENAPRADISDWLGRELMRDPLNAAAWYAPTTLRVPRQWREHRETAYVVSAYLCEEYFLQWTVLSQAAPSSKLLADNHDILKTCAISLAQKQHGR